MFKEKLEKAITDQQKIGKIHKLIVVPFSSSASESPSENDFSTSEAESNDNSDALDKSFQSPEVQY